MQDTVSIKKKLPEFLDVSNQQSENKIKRRIPSITASKRRKEFGKRNARKTGLRCEPPASPPTGGVPRAGRLDLATAAGHPRTLRKFRSVPVEIPADFCAKVGGSILILPRKTTARSKLSEDEHSEGTFTTGVTGRCQADAPAGGTGSGSRRKPGLSLSALSFRCRCQGSSKRGGRVTSSGVRGHLDSHTR